LNEPNEIDECTIPRWVNARHDCESLFGFSISMIQYEEWLSSNWGGPSARVNHHCTIVE
jgi:hypothetical protein